MRIATIQQYAVFTEYLTLLSFESFHIGLVREMFSPLQSTVNEATRGIRRSIPMMLCGLLSNLLWQGYIISILQHFATKLWNITNFVMLFQAVMKFLSRLVEFKILVNWGIGPLDLVLEDGKHQPRPRPSSLIYIF